MDKKILLGVTGALLISGAATINAHAAESDKSATVIASSMNLRSLKEHKLVVGSLFKGDKVTIKNDLGDGFVHVKTRGGIEGKCSKQFLKVGNADVNNKNLNNTTLSNVNSSTATIKKVIAPKLNIRSGAGTKYAVKATLKKDDKVKVLETNRFGWSKVEYNRGKIGYCSSVYLVKTNLNTISTNVAAASTSNNEISVSKKYANKMSSYTTKYKAGGNRAKNVELAASKINGTIIKPGQVFSYDKTLGKRDKINGFVDAPVMANGEIVGDGIGGGICQVSSTLYASALKAGLTDIVSKNHSGRVGYMNEPGSDAVIAYGVDLKIRNTYKEDIVIHASAIGGVLTIEFRSVNPLLNGKKYEFNTISSKRGLTVELQLVEKSSSSAKVVYKRTSHYVK